MADRFSGTISIGGKLTAEQEKTLREHLVGLVEDDDLEISYFSECAYDGATELVEYCKSQNIPLAIQWDAKWEFGSFIEYWVDGNYKQYDCDVEGNIVVSVAYLQDRVDRSVAAVIDGLEIPEFPALELEEQPSL